MKVTCANCKAKIEKKEAFYIKNGTYNTYYCNEDCFNKKNEAKLASKKAKEIKDKIYNTISSIFGYEVQNTVLYKEWAYWNKVVSNDTILSYLEKNKSYITTAVSKIDSSEYAKIRYFSAILKNKLKDYSLPSEQTKVEKIIVDCEIYTPAVSKNKKRRKGLAELEDEVV